MLEPAGLGEDDDDDDDDVLSVFIVLLSLLGTVWIAVKSLLRIVRVPMQFDDF